MKFIVAILLFVCIVSARTSAKEEQEDEYVEDEQESIEEALQSLENDAYEQESVEEGEANDADLTESYGWDETFDGEGKEAIFDYASGSGSGPKPLGRLIKMCKKKLWKSKFCKFLRKFLRKPKKGRKGRKGRK